MLKVALIHDALLPVEGYGGTERLVWWLAKGLSEEGVKVKLVCLPGSQCPFAEVVYCESGRLPENVSGTDILHYFNTPSFTPINPYVVTIGGNGKLGEKFLPNTVFISRNHAERHGSDCFVYNGVDPSESIFGTVKKTQLLFLAKAKWSVKNVQGAIRIARESHTPLKILGGSRWWLPKWRGVEWMGMSGGEVKAQTIAHSRALLFPVRWHEPFGLAVVESLLSGTPVLASSFGSLPELVSSDVGKICHSYREFIEAVPEMQKIPPKRCRDWALENFSHRVMARNYLKIYEKVLSGKNLHSNSPTIREETTLLNIPS